MGRPKKTKSRARKDTFEDRLLSVPQVTAGGVIKRLQDYFSNTCDISSDLFHGYTDDVPPGSSVTKPYTEDSTRRLYNQYDGTCAEGTTMMNTPGYYPSRRETPTEHYIAANHYVNYDVTNDYGSEQQMTPQVTPNCEGFSNVLNVQTEVDVYFPARPDHTNPAYKLHCDSEYIDYPTTMTSISSSESDADNCVNLGPEFDQILDSISPHIMIHTQETTTNLDGPRYLPASHFNTDMDNSFSSVPTNNFFATDNRHNGSGDNDNYGSTFTTDIHDGKSNGFGVYGYNDSGYANNTTFCYATATATATAVAALSYEPRGPPPENVSMNTYGEYITLDHCMYSEDMVTRDHLETQETAIPNEYFIDRQITHLSNEDISVMKDSGTNRQVSVISFSGDRWKIIVVSWMKGKIQ